MLNKILFHIGLVCLVVLFYPHGQLRAQDDGARIMTGAGVYLRQAPERLAKRLTPLLQIGTIVFPLERTVNATGEVWYKITTQNGQEGWVLGKYSMSLDNFSNRGEAYIEVANRKINSKNFGDLVDLCHFLNRVSFEVTQEQTAALLKLLHIIALQRSLENIPRHQQQQSHYSKWLKHQRANIEYNNLTGVWSVKLELFQQWYDEYSHLPIAKQMQQVLRPKTNPSNRAVQGNEIFITHLDFMDPSAGMTIESGISTLINRAVRAGVQLAQQDMPNFKLNESGHRIENSDKNVNQFINIFFDFNLTKGEKIKALIQKMMTPNKVDVILTGQYLEKTGGVILVRPLMLSKSHRRTVTRNLIFQKNEFMCSYNALCQGAHERIRGAVKELLGNL
ncbi:hypothetical protein PN36_08840 [Candidatus Thiomargarita nelsonii]|uniref:SH3b domain-containing protein n=1 Tax=Candidatus Thiomargarita nelsonii TaxID=1003181 RepID=A0A0A6RVT4_9GAMM|nr:hypothetical protein PN36_08840 [Candidatus Thiomargarita nelsonii]